MKKGSNIIFITGGARSGKSTFAMTEAEKIEGDQLYIATAEPLDDEMKERIQKHRDERGALWDTIEEPIEITSVLSGLDRKYNVVLIDCVTIWLSNVILDNETSHKDGVDQRIDDLIDRLGKIDGTVTIFIVSNEVGMGIVPDNQLAREFRDVAGKMNQQIAGISDKVYMIVSGIPIKVK